MWKHRPRDMEVSERFSPRMWNIWDPISYIKSNRFIPTHVGNISHQAQVLFSPVIPTMLGPFPKRVPVTKWRHPTHVGNISGAVSRLLMRFSPRMWGNDIVVMNRIGPGSSHACGELFRLNPKAWNTRSSHACGNIADFYSLQ